MRKALLQACVAGAILAIAVLVPVEVSVIHSRASSSSSPPADSVLGVFEGRTPCGTVAVEFTRYASPACEKIKWRLTLYGETGTRQPTTFLYEGTRTSRQGSWRFDRGTPFDSRANVVRLMPRPAGEPLLLLMVDANVLLLLDTDGRVLVGNASWSYALNRAHGPTKRWPLGRDLMRSGR